MPAVSQKPPREEKPAGRGFVEYLRAHPTLRRGLLLFAVYNATEYGDLAFRNMEEGGLKKYYIYPSPLGLSIKLWREGVDRKLIQPAVRKYASSKKVLNAVENIDKPGADRTPKTVETLIRKAEGRIADAGARAGTLATLGEKLLGVAEKTKDPAEKRTQSGNARKAFEAAKKAYLAAGAKPAAADTQWDIAKTFVVSGDYREATVAYAQAGLEFSDAGMEKEAGEARKKSYDAWEAAVKHKT
jgi:hypothetical protein